MIAMVAQPSTSSGLPASSHYSLTDAVNIILNDSSPKNWLAALVKSLTPRSSHHSTQVMQLTVTNNKTLNQKGGVSTQGRSVLKMCFIVYFCFSSPCTIA